MYAVFGLLVARPLFHKSVSTKVCAVALGAFGFLFHALMIGVFIDAIKAEDIDTYAMSTAGLLFTALIAAVFNFKEASSD
jgi:hypothetical protein